ncbi:MAG: nuclear transport factor 2 family protein [Pseudomonadota bacterium]
MSDLKNLFDRWERVWHEGQYHLIPGCMAASYIRHDELGDRAVTPEAYATEIANAHRARPNTRFVVYEHMLANDRAWYHFTLQWTDAKTGETRTRAGMQLYRIEAGKLAETWLTLLPLGTAWPDAVAQKTWTSTPPSQNAP